VTCLRQYNPYISVQEFCDIVRQCGNRADNPDVRYGYGIPDLALAMDLLHVEDNPMQVEQIINVYPNPAQGDVHVILKEGHNADITVYDFMGRQLFSYDFNGLNHTSLESFLNTLGSGVYFINANSELGSQTIKVVLTR